MQQLYLAETTITDASLSAIAKNLHNLVELDISSCSLITDDGFKTIAMNASMYQSLSISLSLDV